MPMETAVAATMSETASDRVASSSMPARRRENFLSAAGEAKPTFLANSAVTGIRDIGIGDMGIRDMDILGAARISANHFLLAARIRRQAGAHSAKLWRSY
jgi:hypothetical protein